ncbi:(+)-neomenthol dehydrogenase-like [Coffea arabica]|uniref:Short-chain dehydrogenase/reductase n=1 Tax=Coffea arabica TaxID=13443 RepID=A0A6P6WNE5_COFAR|nr:(+)-neomenthol dehydrogenase-like [Coffea arabica]
MAEASIGNSPKRCAVVTGANRGIGLEICRQLASQGITVVLTARDEKRGLDALHRLRDSGGLSGNLLFHQLDVGDSSSVASLAEFINTELGRLDILVNNAGIGGALVDEAAAAAGTEINFEEIATQTYELAVECLQTNYYGAKRMVEACVPLLQLSESPRIVSVSSSMGKLECIKNGWAKRTLGDAENLTEERVDKVVKEFLQDFNEGYQEAKGWPLAYVISKAALNAYTRILAKRFPDFKVNCVCPGFVKTDINYNTGTLPVEEGAESPVKLALLSNDGPSGLFFSSNQVTSFE